MEAPLLLPISAAAGGSPSSISTDDAAASSPPPPSSVSNQTIALRLLAVLTIACASLLAQHEASKGFGIAVVNGAGRGSVAGRRFHLFYASNGRAERILHRASRGVERVLFPDASFPRKRVTRVTLRMDEDGHNLTTVGAGAGGEYVISLSPSLMSADNKPDAAAVAAAVRRAVARMWLWDGRGAVPPRVTESMVEYLASSGADDEVVITTSPPLEEVRGECMSARFLRHLEQRRSGFVARLNRAMRDRWSDAAVDAALGAPARPVCAAYLAATATRGSSVAM